MRPLADIMRPKVIEDVVGQKHIIGEGKLITNLIKSGNIPNMIFTVRPAPEKQRLLIFVRI